LSINRSAGLVGLVIVGKEMTADAQPQNEPISGYVKQRDDAPDN